MELSYRIKWENTYKINRILTNILRRYGGICIFEANSPIPISQFEEYRKQWNIIDDRMPILVGENGNYRYIFKHISVR